MAAIFIASFTSAALLHRFTALALLLCAVAMVTLVLSVVDANVRSPRRRRAALGQAVSEDRRLRSAPEKRPPGK
jgi:succinate dehydrogenase hydrophobic anchor subunit